MEKLWMVYRYPPSKGDLSPALPRHFSASNCTRGQEIGILESYATRDEAARDAAHLEAHVDDPSCLYAATRIAELEGVGA